MCRAACQCPEVGSSKNRFYDILQGDVFELISQGGGGVGNPYERPREQVRDDVVNGFVSIGSALEDHEVALKRRAGKVVIVLDEISKRRSLKKNASATKERQRGGTG